MDQRKGNLKWTPEMETALVGLVYLLKAYRKGAENIKDKYTKIIVSLWKLVDFSSQGTPLATGAMQKKFTNIYRDFKIRYGLSDDGERSNMSAISEDPPPMDIQLLDIYKEVEEKKDHESKKNASEDEKKRNLSDITDVVVKGLGKKGLLQLADETEASCGSTTSAGVKEFG